MAGQETQTQKNCRIKTAGINRYMKEYKSYCKELEQDQGKVDKLVADGADLHSINKMVRKFSPKKILERSYGRNKNYGSSC